MCLAIPGKVLNIEKHDELMQTGQVDFDGIKKEINLSLVEDLKVGDYVIVHVGFAISKMNESAAKETLAIIATEEANFL